MSPNSNHFKHDERRKHKRFPIIKDLAEPIELAMVDSQHMSKIPGILTNFSAGGMEGNWALIRAVIAARTLPMTIMVACSYSSEAVLWVRG